jgi:hypothetical protein
MSSQARRVVWLCSIFLCTDFACSQSPSTPPSGTGGSGSGGSAQGTGGRGGAGSGGNSAGQGGSASPGSGGVSAGATGGTSGGSGGGPAGTGGSGAGGSPGDAGTVQDTGAATGEKFSFFVASMEGMVRLSKNPKGFGGDLRYGQADGISGADKICTELAEASMPGAGAKGWRAFLSAQMGPDGKPVDAIDRIGEGPWYDRKGRVMAMNKAGLLSARPMADPAIANDLPNEFGIGNHRPDPTKPAVDNHHVLTGSNEMGRLYGPTSTCNSWTALGTARPRIGFSWPAGGRLNWISGQDEGGCGAGINIGETGGSDPSNPIVGSGGGYGGIYCFALKP